MDTMNKVFITKEQVRDHFMKIANKINGNYDCLYGYMCGFYFKNEYFDSDINDDFWNFDKIIDYVKNRSFDDLLYYYFENWCDDNIVTIYVHDYKQNKDKYDNMTNNDILWYYRHIVWIDDGSDNDILRKIDPSYWYDEFKPASYFK
jgi:hypothetical protein